MPMCSLSLPHYFFLSHPYGLPLSTHDVYVGYDVKPETAVWLLWPCGIANPNKSCQAPAKPVLGANREPPHPGTERTLQPHREVFASSHEAKKCRCLCLNYILPPQAPQPQSTALQKLWQTPVPGHPGKAAAEESCLNWSRCTPCAG